MTYAQVIYLDNDQAEELFKEFNVDSSDIDSVIELLSKYDNGIESEYETVETIPDYFNYRTSELNIYTLLYSPLDYTLYRPILAELD